MICSALKREEDAVLAGRQQAWTNSEKHHSGVSGEITVTCSVLLSDNISTRIMI